MLIHKTNFLMRALYPEFVWKVSTDKKEIFLTFDDGPVPQITEFVLDELAKYQAKATFFCIGDNVEKHPAIFDEIKKQGHSVGNHTFNHLKGWNTPQELYIENFKKCERSLNSSTLFRPPYGRIKRSQATEILKTHQVIMWDVLSGDYDNSISKEKVLDKTLQYTEHGSIVLFHDSVKASVNMMYALPKFLQHFSERGFSFVGL